MQAAVLEEQGWRIKKATPSLVSKPLHDKPRVDFSD